VEKQRRTLLDEVQLSANLLTREASSLVADILFELRAKVHRHITDGSSFRCIESGVVIENSLQ